MDVIKGQRDVLVGKIQERYGATKEDASMGTVPMAQHNILLKNININPLFGYYTSKVIINYGGALMTNGKKANRLIFETSPYLLQHAYNPVEWYPWGEEAFKKAKEEEKPIFLSIGYSTCHWCHVMERESFEREDVAGLMNNAFINIKVDREERQDIDNVYMSVCQILTGNGGWPLTIIMTPEQKPFFAGTYLPRNSQYGRMGMTELIPKVQVLWNEKRDNILESSKQIEGLLHKNEKRRWQHDFNDDNISSKNEMESLFKKAYHDLEYTFDDKMGGFGGAPKFPTPHRLLFLLRYWKKTMNNDVLDMVKKTLDQMRMGGIFDQIGFGFHRYSTDQNWLVPHFEKMLYDQGLMIIAYLEAFQATKDEKYKETVREIITYVMSNLKDKNGGFYSAEDADSEGEEGKFYLWTDNEIRELLGEKADYTKHLFSIKKEGNFRDESSGSINGKNILYLDQEEKLVMIDKTKVNEIRGTLLNERNNRIRPHLDDKVLIDWNGIMIAALAMAGRVLNNEEYINYAIDACDFILENVNENKKIHHRYCKGKWDISGHLDDYAFFIYALIELYESTFDNKYLLEAEKLTKDTVEMFWDKENAGFYFTSNEGEKLIIRKKEIYDGAIPSGNSIMLINLLKLSIMIEDSNFSQIGNDLIKYFFHEIKEHPTGYTQMLCGIYFAYEGNGEVTIKGDLKNVSTRHMIKSINLEYLPNILIKVEENHKGKTTATLCYNQSCGQATNDIEDIIRQVQ